MSTLTEYIDSWCTR